MGEADSAQSEVLDFMGRPHAYDPPPATVERIDTHGSSVFLAGPFAYKVKRAVKYPFLDFSTLEKRRAACLNELRVNARTAPQLYLEVLPITAGTGGKWISDWRQRACGRMGAAHAPFRSGQTL